MTPPNTVTLEDFHLPGELIAEAMSPALLIFLDHVRHNVARMIHATGGDPDRWRPHLRGWQPRATRSCWSGLLTA